MDIAKYFDLRQVRETSIAQLRSVIELTENNLGRAKSELHRQVALATVGVWSKELIQSSCDDGEKLSRSSKLGWNLNSVGTAARVVVEVERSLERYKATLSALLAPKLATADTEPVANAVRRDKARRRRINAKAS